MVSCGRAMRMRASGSGCGRRYTCFAAVGASEGAAGGRRVVSQRRSGAESTSPSEVSSSPRWSRGCGAVADRTSTAEVSEWRAEAETSKPRVIIAGGGIGGLCAALALQSKGIPFMLSEKVKEYKPFGGPIQLQCNALEALEAIDMGVARQVMDLGTITGDRINGLLDGKTGEWFIKFDTRKPALRKGLPLTLVLNRYVLLDIL